MKLDLDDAGLDVGANQDEVSSVGLNRRTHEIHQSLELVQPIGPLGLAQPCGDVRHSTILPRPAPHVTRAQQLGI